MLKNILITEAQVTRIDVIGKCHPLRKMMTGTRTEKMKKVTRIRYDFGERIACVCVIYM